MDMKNGRKSRASIENLEFRFGSSSSQTSQTSGDFCRICHESESINPLLTPCLCSGSLRYVHELCLIQWLTASETNSCELCKFPFIMQSKIKPFNEWRSLDMSGVERRRLFCAVLFHLAAALCVIWSLCVLIERSAEEVRSDKLGWPFWTKLVVVTVGLTGAIVFIYIQCKQYLNLCSRWRARNRILLIQNAPERIPTNQPQSPLALRNSRHSSNATLHRNNSSMLVITTPMNNANAFERNNQQSSLNEYQHQQQQQSQIVANIENNSSNFELDDDGFSQISFKQHLRHDERNSSKGSLHNVYDNMSISTTNTSATTRNYTFGDVDLKTNHGLEDVREADNDDKRRIQLGDQSRTSMFIENSDILSDQNYPKLFYRHSTFLLPTTAKNSHTVENEIANDKRRYSDTKLLNSLYFENEFLVKKTSHDDILGSPTRNDVTSEQLELNIQNILEIGNAEQKEDRTLNGSGSSKTSKEKQNLFKSLPNLESTLM